ncbi:trigger factor [soil metagenome]
MKTDTLQTTSERIDKDRVKLRVEVPEGALTPAVNAVYRRWAKEIRVPGFRTGKVPRQLIDARVGADVVREEAVRDALPDLYRDALRAEDIEAIAPPEIEVLDLDPGSPLVFEALVDIRPQVVVPDLSEITVDAPSEEVTDEDVDEQLDRLRERFAELETVGREARRGDFVLIDLKGYRDDQPVEDASAPDFLYEIGSRTGPAKLDDELESSRPGAILRFNDLVAASGEGDEPPEEISFTVLVKEVKSKKLPPLDDDFAKTVGEFDDIDGLRGDLRERLAEVKREIAKDSLRALVLERLVNASDLEPPEKLVETEFDHQLEHFQEDLGRAGLTIDDYARQTQATELEIRRDVRSQAQRSVKAELLLEEVARREEIGVDEEEIGREIAIAAARAERDPKEVAEQLVQSGRLSVVAADIMRRKALDHVVDNVNVSGRAVVEESEE